ncbi:hypothetical protein Pmar_PMAR005879 [Perkinsus marinus ATCC 50983]|uniref:Uncharacterized protein n=1 Tax=Perkinsus marinus (strain ATCC 50983 / TXsc) TaxID=423536 RepID=C5KYG7_PERM5|nr:hypothetical protein Pmar_PMAR005879 [Perkinsus marinus ATCC 50983]EER10544.1 hypothetical protein Pmar_PMAR005879 [Perkinsus marinus ATCC 50983]|eukprot:XP_002778749.1 hypothetical protein Pmar_PMAR005879 [Perkinsus marinus ATCC 50983]
MATAMPGDFVGAALQPWGSTIVPSMDRAIPPHLPPPPVPPPSAFPPRTSIRVENMNIINDYAVLSPPGRTSRRPPMRSDNISVDQSVLSMQRPQLASPLENPEPSGPLLQSPRQQQQQQQMAGAAATSRLLTTEDRSIEDGVSSGMCAECRANGVPPGFCMHDSAPIPVDHPKTSQQQQKELRVISSRDGSSHPRVGSAHTRYRPLRLRAFLGAQRAELERYLGNPELVEKSFQFVNSMRINGPPEL